MKNQIKPRDYKLLSAYLDNQISSKDRAYLEKRLKAIPELQKELHELSKTRLLLRSMPKLRAPHNYLISVKTAQVNQREPATPRMAPVMGIISAVATILLVLVIFSGNVLTPASPRIETSAVEAPAQSLAVEQEVQRESEISPTTTDAAPMAMMEAAPVSSTEPPTEPVLEMEAPPIVPVETSAPTPTTIYLDAYPPTETPEDQVSKYSELAEATQVTCEEFLKNPGAFPTLSQPEGCITPTSTQIGELLHSFVITETIITSATTTPTITPTPAPTSTPLPTETSLPEPSSTPPPTETPAPSLKGPAPTEAVLSIIVSPEIVQGVAPTVTVETLPAQTQENATSTGFVPYMVLAAEISLAIIAIGTGLLAIFLRLRAGR